jgi:hypothetical protein
VARCAAARCAVTRCASPMRVRRRPPMRLRRLRLHLFRLLGTLLVLDWCGVDLCLLTVRAVLSGSISLPLDCTPFRRRSTDTGCTGRLRSDSPRPASPLLTFLPVRASAGRTCTERRGALLIS